MVLVFSSEPTKETWTDDKITHKLFEWIENNKDQAGEIIFPDCLYNLNHRGLETVLKKSKSIKPSTTSSNPT